MKRSRYLHAIPTVNGEYAVYNALTDSLSVVTQSLWKAIEEERFDAIPGEVRAQLGQIGVLLDDGMDELRLISVRLNKFKYQMRAVTGFTVLTTTACNFACPYCYEGAPNAPRSVGMSEDVLNRTIQHIKRQVERNGSQVLSLVLFGGEPLANKPVCFRLLEELHRWCNDQKITFVHAIVTNGSLLDQETADKLAAHNCNMIQITVDGPREIHDSRRFYKGGKGSYDRIMEALKLVYNHPVLPSPCVRINVDRSNVDQVPVLLDELVANGLQGTPVDFGIVHAQTEYCASYSDACYAEEELPDFLPELWRAAIERGLYHGVRPRLMPTFCSLQSDFQSVIDSQGNIYKCWEHMGSPEYRVGTIDDDTPTGRFYVDWMSRDAANQDECRACDLLPICGGGCSQTAVKNHGTIHAPGCSRTKGLIRHRLEVYLEQTHPHLKRSGAFAKAETGD